jgi:hypothetical protein
MKFDDIVLGNKYVDEVTQVSGIATGKLETSHSNDLVRIEGRDTTGRPFEHWADPLRLADHA